jgi:hypothetical protein
MLKDILVHMKMIISRASSFLHSYMELIVFPKSKGKDRRKNNSFNVTAFSPKNIFCQHSSIIAAYLYYFPLEIIHHTKWTQISKRSMNSFTVAKP